MLDLSPDLGQIRMNLRQKWRNQLNRAEKNDVSLTIGTDDHLYEIFHDMQRKMQQRKGYTPEVDYGEFGQIQSLREDQHKMTIIVASHGSSDICTAIFTSIGDRGIYLLGATDDEGMKLKGSYLLQWKAIELMKERGDCWYDLGGINPETNPGVFHFKSGMTESEFRHIGYYEYSRSAARSTVFSAVDQLRRRIRT